jgi:hypothetical protein
MPGLVEGLVGAKMNEKREIQVTFPPRSSAPQLAGKVAIFEVDVLKVQQRHLPEPGDIFADRVKTGMTWDELDGKLREGVNQDAEDQLKQAKHAAFEKAVIKTLPADFEVSAAPPALCCAGTHAPPRWSLTPPTPRGLPCCPVVAVARDDGGAGLEGALRGDARGHA